MSTTLATIRKCCPVSVMQATTRRPDVGVEDEPDRVGLAADPERVEVQERAAGESRRSWSRRA